jgi:hypothetical protein
MGANRRPQVFPNGLLSESLYSPGWSKQPQISGRQIRGRSNGSDSNRRKEACADELARLQFESTRPNATREFVPKPGPEL